MNNSPVDPDHRPVLGLLEQCPAYSPTPLRTFPSWPDHDHSGTVWAKDESQRMGLGSFKALGGSYAILRLICDRAGLSVQEQLSLDDPKFIEAARSYTFVCATAGNHGLSVATAANLFGASSVVYIAESVPESFARRLSEKGARVIRQGAVYEDAMAAAMAASEEKGWQLISDSSWDDYREVPRLIYQGYTAMAEECRQQFSDLGQWPDQVFLQAGVGGLAAAVAAHIRQWWPHQPGIFVVEPDAAPCLGRSVARGQLTGVVGPVSSMGRLDCKQASLLAWQSLSQTADRFIEVSDQEAEQAAAMLTTAGTPTTPSGAAGAAGLLKARSTSLTDPARTSLVIVSEGS